MEERILEKLDSIEKGIAEVLENQNSEPEFIFKTHDRHEARVLANVSKLCDALDDLRAWRRNLYKGYDTDGHYYMTEGYLPSIEDKREPAEIPEHDDYSNIDADGRPGKTKYLAVIDEDVVMDKIDRILSDNGIWEIFDD